ncbi:MAG: endonuclease III [Planctomycetes bacterium]|nr:endonuclease III [Planctomycetota bacterium]
MTPDVLLRRVRGLLVEQYGPRPWQSHGPAVDVLIATILSQSTSRANSRTACRRLRERFGTWDDVADAPVGRIEACIRPAGLSRRKAPRIRAILRRLRADRGRIDLQFLRRRPQAEAMAYLLDLDGVGVKTACCVLMFSFGMPVFPVDTHILRIAVRLGVLAEGATAAQAHAELPPLIPPPDRYAMHLLLIAHGRAVCRARSPRCEDCCLPALCPLGRRRLAAGWG